MSLALGSTDLRGLVMTSKAIITQSNYVPWKGYFTSMISATHLVLYDDMQYTKRDWRNRNKIITRSGPKWLSIPVDTKGKYHQKINETKIKDPDWNLKHWNNIKENYRKAPFFSDYGKVIEEIYLKELQGVEYLSSINRKILERFIQMLGLQIEIIDSRDFDLIGNKTEKLVNICKDLDATEYFTGPAAKSYMQEDLFTSQGIKVNYYNLDGFQEYNQMWDGFDHFVSIIDMFMNLGEDTIKYFNREIE